MDVAYFVRQLIISAPPILIAIVLHEVAHGYIASKLGDPTARLMGRLTLNPLSHIDLFGTVIMPLMLFVLTSGQFVFGYAKPVPINPLKFRNPKRDMALCALGGPCSNVALAIISVVLMKYVLLPASGLLTDTVGEAVIEPLARMLRASVFFNIVLATLNMIPIPPLDGGRVVMGILPEKQAALLGRIEPYGFIIVMLLLVTGIANHFMWPAMALLLRLIESI
jgi:Zn-dependent protease